MIEPVQQTNERRKAQAQELLDLCSEDPARIEQMSADEVSALLDDLGVDRTKSYDLFKTKMNQVDSESA